MNSDVALQDDKEKTQAGESAFTRWIGILFFAASCALVVLYFRDSVWTLSVDISHHYALVSRLAEYGRLPAAPDPSLAEMNIYPRYSHYLAAWVGQLLGSSLTGMQVVALFFLTILWIGWAFLFRSLPPQSRGLVSAALAALLFLNASAVHLEVFGREIVNNYFFAQLVGQSLAVVVIAVALHLERKGLAPAVRYLFLGGSVPIIEQFHPLPAFEVLGLLALLAVVDVGAAKREDRSRAAYLGFAAVLASLLLAVLSPTFDAIRQISENNGVLELAYTSSVTGLAVESLLLIVLSGVLFFGWVRTPNGAVRSELLLLKYVGLLGSAIAGLCLLQIAALNIGWGSVYACKKYAFGLNTLLLLQLPLFLCLRFKAGSSVSQPAAPDRAEALFRSVFPGLLAVLIVFTVLPAPSSRVFSVAEVIPVERFALMHRSPIPGAHSGNYDYAAGLFGDHHVLDYLITVGVLKSPRNINAEDLLMGRMPGKPKRIDRIFTREGSRPWDVPKCRKYTSPAHLAILDGQCVLRTVAAGPSSSSP